MSAFGVGVLWWICGEIYYPDCEFCREVFLVVVIGAVHVLDGRQGDVCFVWKQVDVGC